MFSHCPCIIGITSLQTRTKLQQALKDVLNCCKLEMAFICQIKLSNSSDTKTLYLSQDLISDGIYKFQCGFCNEYYYGKSTRLTDIRSDEHIIHRCLTSYRKEGQTNQSHDS